MKEWVICNKESMDSFLEKYIGVDNMYSIPNYIKNMSDNIEIVKSIVSGDIIELNSNSIRNLRDYSFYECTSLKSINLPNVITVGQRAFSACTSLKSINLPNATSIGEFAFSDCTSLKSINLPNATSIKGDTFRKCTSLKSINLPNATNIGGSSFYECTSLKSIDLPSVTSIKYGAFSGCTLDRLVLGSPTKCILETSIPLSDIGLIFVPRDLLESYKTDANWSKYANKIIASGLSTIGNKNLIFNNTENVVLEYYKPIENPNANISNIQVTSSDTNGVTVTDVVDNGENISFNINTLTMEGTYTINISMNIGEETYTTSFDVSVYETLPEPFFAIENVNEADYEFILNNNGYYESNNKGVNNSAAICKVVFNTYGIYNLYLDCINNGETNYDFGILSNIDTTLGTTYTADTSNVFKSFKGASSTSINTVDYGIPESGEHFIYIKFRKDSSGNSGNDSLQFKVRFE